MENTTSVLLVDGRGEEIRRVDVPFDIIGAVTVIRDKEGNIYTYAGLKRGVIMFRKGGRLIDV